MEKNLENLTMLYHQIASEKRALNREKDQAFKKLEKKNDIIKDQEKKLEITTKQF